MSNGHSTKDSDLDRLLAGPILRRTEATRVCVWLATSAPAAVRGEVFAGRDAAFRPADAIGEGDAETVRVGERLFVHLVSIRPKARRFPTDELLAYDLTIEDEQGLQHRLADLGLLEGAGRITYGALPLPTFFIREKTPELTVLHGSCRQLHAGGEDALMCGDAFVAKHALDPDRRPCALFLTGDQIYADDVPGPIVRHLTELGQKLTGLSDDVPGIPALDRIAVYGRSNLAKDKAGFTSPEAFNHLFGLGEFTAAYVTAWNEKTWPRSFPPAKEVIDARRLKPPAALVAHRKYAEEVRALERTRRALPRVRRLLANTPTYMIFDDHDVTDDWNITADWRKKVEESPTGRRVVANALAAYWAFQGWGNDPERANGEIRDVVAGRANGSVDGDTFDKALWSFDRWSFVAPTDPLTLFLDTRTQRGYDSAERGARLVGASGLVAEADLARKAGHSSGLPLLIVSPVPVCGLELVERRQKYLVRGVGPYAIDFEAWHSNLQGFVDLVHFLLDDLELPWAIMLSGDVHYGFTVNVTVEVEGRPLPITQLVSSPLRHSGALSRLVLSAVGLLSREKHERVGWDRPPKVEGAAALKRKLLQRPSNTDDWKSDAPVFVAPKLAKTLGVTEPPRYREWRDYVSIEESHTSLVGLNNIGLMSLRGGQVTHRLLARKGGRIHTFTASVAATRDDSHADDGSPASGG